MTVNTEPVLVDPVDIMVFTYIDTVAVMIDITAPHEIMIPQMLTITEIIGKERKGTEDRCREHIVLCHQLLRHHGP